MSDRAQVVGAIVPPGRIAVLSLDDTLARGLLPVGAAALARAARAALAAVGGEPTERERELWLALTPDEREWLLKQQPMKGKP